MQWLPAVGPTGDNLVKPAADPRLAAWWRGPTLAQVRGKGLLPSSGRVASSTGRAAGQGCRCLVTARPVWRPSIHPATAPLLCPAPAQAIDAFSPTHRLVEKPLRLPVSDVVRGGKAGVTVGGKLEGGALRVGSRVAVMPSGQQAAVK